MDRYLQLCLPFLVWKCPWLANYPKHSSAKALAKQSEAVTQQPNGILVGIARNF
jgi:hypothetical protein